MAIERFYETMDARLGLLLDRAASGDTPTAVLVISDHGFKIGAERPRHPALRGDVFAAEWHSDPGVILAWGAGVRRGARVEGATLYDITPTVLSFFGEPASEEMRGRVLEEIFEPSFLPPVARRVPAYARKRREPAPSLNGAPTTEGPGAEEQEILENLRALGYVGGASGEDASVRASSNLATFYLEEGQHARAIEIYERILEREPEDLIALYNLGWAYRGLGAHAKAAAAFERLLGARPDYIEARLVLSDCYASLGQVSRALETLRAAREEERELPGYQNHLGTVLATAGRPGEAIAAFERAIALRPDEASAYLNLARLLMAKGERAKAAEVLRRAREASPGDRRVAERLRDLGESG
jgi:Flp pilus assembly protein TadD